MCLTGLLRVRAVEFRRLRALLGRVLVLPMVDGAVTGAVATIWAVAAVATGTGGATMSVRTASAAWCWGPSARAVAAVAPDVATVEALGAGAAAWEWRPTVLAASVVTTVTWWGLRTTGGCAMTLG